MTKAVEVARVYEGIIERFTAWAAGESGIRAAVVIGSRARVDHPADEWADLDIVIWSTDRRPYLEDGAWTARLGEPWITFVEEGSDPRVLERRVLFAGGLDVDFAFLARSPGASGAATQALADVAGLVFGRGARVLLDRDGSVTRMLASLPTKGSAAKVTTAVVQAPDAAKLDQPASDFWYHAVWTAKHLRRGELWWAKSSCDGHLKRLLLEVLEWDAAAHGRDPWFRGRFLEEWADPAVVRGLADAFGRYDEDGLWAALGVTMDLYATVGRRVATVIGLPYPTATEDRARELVAGYEATRPAG